MKIFFVAGSKLLIRELPSLLDGSAQAKAKPQDETKATLAPKVLLSVHNKLPEQDVID